MNEWSGDDPRTSEGVCETCYRVLPVQVHAEPRIERLFVDIPSHHFSYCRACFELAVLWEMTPAAADDEPDPDDA